LTDTLFDLTLKLARKLGHVKEGIATGGSTTTLIDLDDLDEADDAWNGGTVWVTRTTDALAPQREYARVADFTNSTNLADLADTLTAALGAGDRYAIAPHRYRLHDLIAYINTALLSRLGAFPTSDVTLTAVSSQTEYALPNVAANYMMLRVWEQRRTGAANDNQWVERFDWDIEPQGGGADTIIFDSAPVGGRLIKIEFMIQHAELFLVTDPLVERILPERIVGMAATEAIQARLADPADEDQTLTLQMQNFREDSELARAEFPVDRPRRATKMLTFPSLKFGRRYPGDREPR